MENRLDPEVTELFREMAALQRMADQLQVADAHGGAGVAQERSYALRRAAVAQCYRGYVEQQDPDPPALAEALDDGAQTALRLRDFDAEHGTGRGPVAPGDARWAGSGGAAGYVRQEAAADRVEEERTAR